jgi:hypothetical protein
MQVRFRRSRWLWLPAVVNKLSTSKSDLQPDVPGEAAPASWSSHSAAAAIDLAWRLAWHFVTKMLLALNRTTKNQSPSGRGAFGL